MITKQTLLTALSRFLADCKNIFASKGDTYTKKETNSRLDEKVDKVLMEKTYPSYTASANDQNKGWIYFINVVPTDANWATPWSVRYRLFVSTSEMQTQGKYDCTIGTAGTNPIYLCYNEYYSGSYVPISTHLVSFYNSSAKYANRETYPIKIGAKIQSARNPTTLARIFKIQIIETIGCTVSFTDTIETYDSYYDANKYGQASQISGSMGLQETGDVNYANYYNYYYYNGFRLSDANAPLYRYKLVGFDEKMRVIPFNITDQPSATIIEKTPCSLGFTVSNGMAYYGTTPTISSTTVSIGNGTLYRDHTATSSATVAAYNFNTVVGNSSNDTLHSNVYWCGSYEPLTDKFYLDTSTSTSWYTVVSNNADDTTWKQSFQNGKYYWLIGQTCESDGYFAFLANHPLYYFDGNSKKLIPATAKIAQDNTPLNIIVHPVINNNLCTGFTIEETTGQTPKVGMNAIVTFAASELICENMVGLYGSRQISDFRDGGEYPGPWRLQVVKSFAFEDMNNSGYIIGIQTWASGTSMSGTGPFFAWWDNDTDEPELVGYIAYYNNSWGFWFP